MMRKIALLGATGSIGTQTLEVLKQRNDYELVDIEKYDPKDILPVIIILKDNKEVARITGEKRKKEIEEAAELATGE